MDAKEEIAQLEAKLAELKAKYKIVDVPKKKATVRTRICSICGKTDPELVQVNKERYAHVNCLPDMIVQENATKRCMHVAYLSFTYSDGVTLKDIQDTISKVLPNVDVRTMNVMEIEK